VPKIGVQRKFGAYVVRSYPGRKVARCNPAPLSAGDVLV
jgi:hypothetical protein